jgi:hypothetical protein
MGFRDSLGHDKYTFLIMYSKGEEKWEFSANKNQYDSGGGG